MSYGDWEDFRFLSCIDWVVEGEGLNRGVIGEKTFGKWEINIDRVLYILNISDDIRA